MEKFWMVYGFGQNAPACRHATREIAETEAQRLAGLVRGVAFFVLETVSVAKKVDVKLHRFDDPNFEDGIPF